MTILTKYILREYTKSFVLTLLAFVMIYVLVDFFERVDNFIEAGQAIQFMPLYVLLKLPLIVDQMTPVSVLMAVIITLGLLARENEVIALKASGISPFRLVTPLLLMAGILGVLSFFNSEFIVPYTNRGLNTIWNVHVEKQSPEFIHRYDSLWYRGDKTIYSIRTFDAVNDTLYGMIMTEFDGAFKIKRRIHAKSVVWKGGNWEFQNGTIKERRNGSYEIEVFSNLVLSLPETPEDFKQGVKPSDEMGFRQLRHYARELEQEGYRANTYWVDMHVKLAFPFISFIMALVGSALALRKERGQGIAAGIGIGFIIVALYLVMFELSRTLGYAGVLPAMVAAWAPNLIFAAIGTYLLLGAKG